MIDRLAAGDRTRWDFFLSMGLIEFLNSVAFALDKWGARDQRLAAAARAGLQNYQAAVLAELMK